MGRYTLSIPNIFGRKPESPAATSAPGTGSAIARELVNRGIAADESGEIEKAMLCYRAAVSADPKFAQAHTCLGIALHASGDVAAAIDAHRQAIALDPGYAAAHYNLGLACLQTGAVAQAEAGFRASLEIRPEFPEAWVGLADALEALGHRPDALAALDKAISQREHYVGALFNASVLLRQMGRLGEAE